MTKSREIDSRKVTATNGDTEKKVNLQRRRDIYNVRYSPVCCKDLANKHLHQMSRPHFSDGTCITHIYVHDATCEYTRGLPCSRLTLLKKFGKNQECACKRDESYDGKGVDGQRGMTAIRF